MKTLFEKYEQLLENNWHQHTDNKPTEGFVLTDLIDTLSDSLPEKDMYYKLKYKELVNDPKFDNSHWDMFDDEDGLNYAKENLNYYYNWYFSYEFIPTNVSPKIGDAIDGIHDNREQRIEKMYPITYIRLFKKYSGDWIKDFKKWKETRDELYKDNPGVNIDI